MKIIPGSKQYPFEVQVDGEDLVVHKVRATWFGGPRDPGDNGIGASGKDTRKDPEFLGYSLPMRDFRGRSRRDLCPGTPLPRLPWFTRARITHLASGRVVEAQLIDVGPSPSPIANAAIDLTPAVFGALGVPVRNHRPTIGELTVSFRILGGAAFLAGR